MLLSTLLVVSLAASDPPKTLRWEPRIDIPVAGVLTAGWLVTEFAVKKELAPAQCRWCQTNAFDVAVRRVFNPTGTPSANGLAGPDAWSNVTSLGMMPVLLAGTDLLLSREAGEGWLGRWGADMVLIVEATMAAMVAAQTVKFFVARARPYTVGASPELLASGRDPADQNLSFFSGHTTFSVGLAVSAGVIATLRGYRYAWVSWAVGVPLAFATAMLRMGADKHWATDVIVGAAVASAFSITIPLVFHGPQPIKVAVQPNGVVVAGSF